MPIISTLEGPKSISGRSISDVPTVMDFPRRIVDGMFRKEKAIVVLSGGMDSTTLLYWVREQGYNVKALSISYGQKHKKELKCAEATCLNLGVPWKLITIPKGVFGDSSLTRKGKKVPEGHYEEESMKATVVPNRNMVLLSLATAYALRVKASAVFYGPHGGDHAIYPDCRSVFVDAMKKAIELCDWASVRLETPFLLWDKAQILKEGIRLGVDYSISWSCYNGREEACGLCGACVERQESWASVGLPDPIKYQGER